MSVKTNEEKWREEFRATLSNNYNGTSFSDGEIDGHWFSEWQYFKAAKTSSYELKENLRKRGNNLSKECVGLQKEIVGSFEVLRTSEGLELLATKRRHGQLNSYFINT